MITERREQRLYMAQNEYKNLGFHIRRCTISNYPNAPPIKAPPMNTPTADKPIIF